MDEETMASLLAPFWRTDDGLTPEERMDQNQAAIDLMDALREGWV